MFTTALRAMIFILEALAIVAPLLGRGRRQKIPLVLKEGTFFVLTNWQLIWKYLEKRKWTIDALKNILRYRRVKR